MDFNVKRKNIRKILVDKCLYDLKKQIYQIILLDF